MRCKVVFYRLSIMNGDLIPQERERASNLATYRLDERHYRVAVKIGIILQETKVECKASLFWTDDYRTDYGDASVGIWDFEHWSATTRRPSPSPQWVQHEVCLINKGQISPSFLILL